MTTLTTDLVPSYVDVTCAGLPARHARAAGIGSVRYQHHRPALHCLCSSIDQIRNCAEIYSAHGFTRDDLAEKRYGHETNIGKALGNSEVGDGAKYKGRGYVQIVGRRNYTKLNGLLELEGTPNDLVSNPDAANIPEIAYKTASIVLIEGLFTGKKMSEFITATEADYIGARRVTNGNDKAELIANDAKKLEAILTSVLQPN